MKLFYSPTHKTDDETTFEQTLCHDVMTLMAGFFCEIIR